MKNYSLKKNARRRKIIIAFVFLIILILIVTCIYQVLMLPTLLRIIEAKVLALSTASINNAVFYAMTERPIYSELISVYKDDSGKINMIQADAIKVNTLARETSRLSQEAINKLGEQGIDVAIGSLSGSPLLVGQGPIVHFKMLPVGTVFSNFFSEFENAGINQTRHKIFLTIEAQVVVILPARKLLVETVVDVLVCENIIVGDVPLTYLNFGGSGRYDLLPKNN